MWRFIFIFFTVYYFIACNSKNEDVTIKYKDRYVDFIKEDKIYFEDGSFFDMSSPKAKRIYYLIRHAEKDTSIKINPPLTDKGESRAAKLSEMLKNTTLTSIFSTMTTRTLFTVDSLSDVKLLPTLPYEEKNMKKMVEEIKSNINNIRILIVGHSNTTPVLANYIHGSTYFQSTFKDEDYDNFVIVIEHEDNTKQLLPLKFKPK